MVISNFIRILIDFIKLYSWLFGLNVIFSAYIVFSEKRKPMSTLLWIMTINFLPIVGFILYIIFARDLSKQKMFDKRGILNKKNSQIAKRQLKAIKAGNFFIKDRTREYLSLIEMFNRGESEVIYTKNDLKKYNNGNEMFEDLIRDIENAKVSIYLQSYIFKSCELGDKILDLLIKKAKEGVEVILLVDAMGARNFKNRDRKKVVKNNIKFALFFPGVFRTISTRINYRNHRKIIVIDHKIGYVGGLNIGDEYISKSKKFGFWRDTHLRIVGDAVKGLQYRFFLDYWFAADKKDGSFISLLEEEYIEDGFHKEVCIVTSGPDTRVNSIRNGYEQMINKAQNFVYIQTPYFVPDDGLFSALKIAALSGCEVNIMIPEKKDHPFVHWASLSYIGELLEYGVNCYFYKGGFLHSKVVVCDDYVSSVGTANFDIRSFELNFEVNAFVFDKELNKSLIEDFKRDMKDSEEYTLEKYRDRSAFVKIKEGVSRLLSPIL